ncbi:MAG: CARDB domain-containing protein [Thermoguttaceae bacterium]
MPGASPLPSALNSSPRQDSAAANRIHQRLSAFRDSQFGSTPAATSDSRLVPDSSSLTAPTPGLAPLTGPTGTPTLAPPKAEEQPRVADDVLPGSDMPEPRLATPAPKYAAEPLSQVGDEGGVGQPAVVDRAPTPSPAATAQPRAAGGSSQVLFTQQSPILNVKTVGPERIDVGREATFNVTVENLGSAVADELMITIDFPQWADLLGAEVSTGATNSEVAADGTRLFRWRIGQLGAKEVQTVALHVVARQSQPLNLAVNWQHAPVASGASISVLHPDLKLNLEGPEEVLFGKKQTYRLELENAGTGDARGVQIALLPLGTGQEKAVVHLLGDLAAGQKKAMEVELTARNEGDLVIQVDATAEGNIEAHLAEKVRVLRAALTVDVSAPEFQFVGQELTYRIVVTNPGTAPASDVRIEAALPESISYLSTTKDDLVSDEGGQIRWTVQTLKPQEARTLLVKCVAAAPGNGRIQVSSRAAENLVALGEATVEIDAIADLALEVTDPAGPVAVGTEAMYELKIENRGSKSAEHVEIVAYFSHGIEPLGAEGGNFQIGPGQIVFDAIPSISAGQAKTFVVRARAETTGNHVIRAEVFCKPLGTRLVGEESTYFFGKRAAEQLQPAPPQPTVAEEGVLTADQRGASQAGENPQQ